MERPWDGIVPDPAQGYGGKRKAGEGRWFAVRIRDGDTGAPISGARLVRTPEAGAGRRLRPAMVMSPAVADPDGIAHVPVDAEFWKDDCHWIALEDGYAPAEDYGAEPEPEMLLRRGQPFRGRLLDPMGKPVAGAAVENLGGCSHGTAAQREIAGSDGIFTFAHSEPSFGQMWVEGPGIASQLLAFSWPLALGTEPASIAVELGYRYEGRVIDLLGRPIQGVTVRHWNEQRGPATTTDPQGRFVLEGVNDDDAHLVLFPALDLTEGEGRLYVDDGAPGVPMTIVLSPIGVSEEDETARIRVRCRLPGGEPVGGIAYRVLGTASGRGPSGYIAEEQPKGKEEPPFGEGVVGVVPGTYRVVPWGPFGEFEFDPVEVSAEVGKEVLAEISVRRRPVLRIRGAVPSATLTLTAAGTSTWGTFDASWSPSLPESAPAVLRMSIRGRPPFFFPVGPPIDGVRVVIVSIPAPRWIRLPAGARAAKLFDGAREAACFEDGDDIATDAVGRLTLRWSDAQGVSREVPVDLPTAPGAEVRIEPTGGTSFAPFELDPLKTEHSVRVLGPGEDGKEEEYDTCARYPGQELVVTREGWRTLRWTTPDGEVLRWGSCAISLRVDVEGNAAPYALALVDGEIYEVPEGQLDLRGFDPGPHRILVNLRDRVGDGRELRFTLGPGETFQRKVTLPN